MVQPSCLWLLDQTSTRSGLSWRELALLILGAAPITEISRMAHAAAAIEPSSVDNIST
jgi:hypothetical protein